MQVPMVSKCQVISRHGASCTAYRGDGVALGNPGHFQDTGAMEQQRKQTEQSVQQAREKIHYGGEVKTGVPLDADTERGSGKSLSSAVMSWIVQNHITRSRS